MDREARDVPDVIQEAVNAKVRLGMKAVDKNQLKLLLQSIFD